MGRTTRRNKNADHDQKKVKEIKGKILQENHLNEEKRIVLGDKTNSVTQSNVVEKQNVHNRRNPLRTMNKSRNSPCLGIDNKLKAKENTPKCRLEKENKNDSSKMQKKSTLVLKDLSNQISSSKSNNIGKRSTSPVNCDVSFNEVQNAIENENIKTSGRDVINSCKTPLTELKTPKYNDNEIVFSCKDDIGRKNLGTPKKKVSNGFSECDAESSKQDCFKDSEVLSPADDSFKGFDVPPLDELNYTISQIKEFTKINSIRANCKTPKGGACKKRNIKSSNKNQSSIKKYLNVLPSKGNSSKTSCNNKSKADNVKTRVPVYVKNNDRKSVPKELQPEDKLHLYDFEVDENEPKVPKRKVILKMKMVRPKKQAKKIVSVPPLFIDDKDLKVVAPTAVPGNKKFSPIDPDIICFNDAPPIETSKTSELSNSNMYADLQPPNLPEFNEHATSMSGEIPVLFQNSVTTNSIDRIDSLIEEDGNRTLEMSNISCIASERSHSSPGEIPASTPVKFNSFSSSGLFSHQENSVVDTSVFNTSNCFGFDEPEIVEEPFVSPIKDPNSIVLTTPAKIEQTVVERLPVKNIIRLLKFGSNDSENESRRLSSPEGNEGPSIQNFLNDDLTPPVTFKSVPRRSYQRPFKPKRLNESYEETSDEEEAQRTLRQHHKKKTNHSNKKQEKELEKWAAQFNSQCKEVEKFDLCVE